MDSLEFYTVCHSKMDSLNRGINSVNQEVNLLTSYSHIYKNPIKPIELPANGKNFMIDSGAYDFLIREKNDDFPFTTAEYAEVMKNLPLDNFKSFTVVSMDYICSREEENDNLELIEKTLDNAEFLKHEFNNCKKINFMPVIQGYKKQEYIHCVKEMVRREIILEGDYVGIGSLVARRKLKETRAIIRSIYNYLKKEILNFKIHCFGINLSIIKDKVIFNMIKSIDSLTWTFPYLYGRVKMFTRESLIEANTDGKLIEPEFYYISLDATLKYIDFLNLRFRNNLDFKDKCLINKRNQKHNYFFYFNLAKKLAGNDKYIKRLGKVNDIIEFILEANETFPRESELITDKIPAYTSKKLLFLESKGRNIGRREFIYLLLSAIENAHLYVNNRNDGREIFNNLIRDFYQRVKNSEFELKIIKKSLKFMKLEKSFEMIFPFDHNKEIPMNYVNEILALKKEITLKRYIFNKDHTIINQSKVDKNNKELVILV